MGLRIIAPKRVKKVKTKNGKEVLSRLENYLESVAVTGEPVEILCGFWEDQQTAITYQELRQAVIDGAISQETLRLWSQDYSVLVANSLSTLWTDAIVAGSAGQPILDGLSFEFNTQTPGILSWFNERGAEFVTASTQEQKDAIAALLTKKMRDGHTVDELSRLIRPCIGLTEGDAKAAVRFYDNIVANLRKEHPRMKSESIRKKALDATQKYAERKHRQRALMIAQTESAFAYNRGADEGVRQAQSEGYLGVVKKRWSTSGDDAVCELCASLEGTEVDMDSDFNIGGRLLFREQHMLPPAHPRCACAVEYIEISKPIVPQPEEVLLQEVKELGVDETLEVIDNLQGCNWSEKPIEGKTELCLNPIPYIGDEATSFINQAIKDAKEKYGVVELFTDEHSTIKEISPQSLKSTQLFVGRQRMKDILPLDWSKFTSAGEKDEITAVKYNGTYVVLDGNHRSAISLLRNTKAIEVRVLDLSEITKRKERGKMRKFSDLIAKSAGNQRAEPEEVLKGRFKIMKSDDEKMLAFGWASVSMRVDGEVIEDWQRDIVEPEELENAAYEFVLLYREGGEMHERGGAAVLIESVVFTEEKMQAMGIPAGTLPVGWWIGFKVLDEDVWEKVKDGTYPMFSIEGEAERVKVEDKNAV